jgi:N-acetylmuramoyl-L-alanine amidase
MTPFFKRYFPLFVIAAALLMIGSYFISRPAPIPPPPAPPRPALSMLTAPPDWSLLEIYQNSITREEFARLLTTVFTTGEAWKNFIQIGETEASIHTGSSTDAKIFHLRFAAPGLAAAVPRHWHTAAELPAAPAAKALAGLKIAIDAGHIGGAWGKMEERWFVVGDGQPVQEGDMTLKVAKLLKPRLEALGASVALVREALEPVTSVRPEALLPLAQGSPTAESPKKLAERLFYRTAEIHARAELVNQVIKPDLVLCLHFNAEGWGDPNQPTLIDHTHLHLLLNGAYTDEEIGFADQRFALLQKLLQRTHQEEALIGASVADTFAEISGLPPYIYPQESKSARPVAGHPYLWARNLLANRLYDCPVIFMEPYVMNSTTDYARIQAGDYQGLREINGKMRPSIFHEYAEAVAEGLKKYYALSRKITEPAATPNKR